MPQRPVLLLGVGRDVPPQSRWVLQGLGPIREAPADRSISGGALSEADLIVLPESALARDPDLVPWLADRSEAFFMLLRKSRDPILAAEQHFDDVALIDSPEDVRARAELLLSLHAAWRRAADLGITAEDLRADLSRYGIDPGLVSERGLVPPGRVDLTQMVDVGGVIRQQMVICELMGTSYGTYLPCSKPRGLPDQSGEESPPMGALSPYCAYLSGRGNECLASEYRIARTAFHTGKPTLQTCSGGIRLFAVPVCLTFLGLSWPLYAATVAVDSSPGDEELVTAARVYDANAEVLRQLADESLHWILSPDRVHGIRATLTNLGETISREASHRYGTAYQLYHRSITEHEMRRSRRLLAESHRTLETTNHRLHLKNEEIYEVTHAITHDLKKPLVSLRAMMSLMRSGKLGVLPETQQEAVETAYEATDYMETLIADILEAARLETGRKLLDIKDVELKPILERIEKRFRYVLDEQAIELAYENLPDAILCDGGAIEKVFMNLIGNSIAYIGEGERRIVVRGAKIDGAVRITVADTGIGIPEDSRDRVFEKFQRGGNVHGTRGTGLGLGIVKGIVEAHGGSVELKSEVGRGTSVSFTVPHGSPVELESAGPRGV